MELNPGEKLGRYQLVSLIGAGGMGEVWKARDMQLDRDVAVKVSKSEFTAWFDREARAIAAFNHPNICQIYDIGPNYLVMELIDGVPLKGPLPVEKAVAYAGLILDALDAAHRKGFTHRDLKPANILVTKQGIKLLDFGLAKQNAAGLGPDDVTSASLTVKGQISGTLQYMSPEQLQGKEADARDIFAFGCVLYEMVSGRKAFSGSTAAGVIAGIMEREPEPFQTTPPLDRVIRKCLMKDSDERFQNARDLKTALLWAIEGGSAAPLQSRFSKTGWIGWVTAALFALSAAALAFVHFRETEPQMVRTAILPPEKSAVTSAANSGPMALSPDGKRIVFAATGEDGKSQLWIRALDGATAQPVPGSEGGSFPFWSPESRTLAFFAGGKLKKIDTAGGPPVTLADASNPRGGAWSSSGIIVFAPNNNVGGLVKISASGGTVTPATGASANNGNGRAPWFLPDGRHFLLTFLQPPNRVQILLASLDSDEIKPIAETGSNAVYSQGQLLFLRESTLMSQPFDLKTFATTGEAVPVAEHIQESFSPNTVGMFSVSTTGLLAYETGVGDYGLQLTWFDRNGKALGTFGAPQFFSQIALSPDGKTLASSFFDAQGQDVYTYDLSQGSPTRFTFDPARDDFPMWTPDGRSIVFNSVRKGHWDLYRKSADGSGAEEVLYADDREKYPNSFSPDGKLLLFAAVGTANSAYWALPLTPENSAATLKPVPFLPGSSLRWGKFSPDGRWVAYVLGEQPGDVYVSSFSHRGGTHQISAKGGIKPLWRRDGKEIFYLSPEGRLMATEVRISGEAVEVGSTHSLLGGIPLGNGYAYDISTDGQRILAAVAVAKDQKSSEPITLVQNWAARLKK